MIKRETVKSFLCGLLFVVGFLFIGSGMFEAVVLKLLEVLGL